MLLFYKKLRFAAFPKWAGLDASSFARKNALAEAIERYVWAMWWDNPTIAHSARQIDLVLPTGAAYWRLMYRYAALGTDRDLDDDDREQEIARGAIRRKEER